MYDPSWSRKKRLQIEIRDNMRRQMDLAVQNDRERTWALDRTGPHRRLTTPQLYERLCELSGFKECYGYKTVEQQLSNASDRTTIGVAFVCDFAEVLHISPALLLPSQYPRAPRAAELIDSLNASWYADDDQWDIVIDLQIEIGRVYRDLADRDSELTGRFADLVRKLLRDVREKHVNR